jgi:hypothetical protein
MSKRKTPRTEQILCRDEPTTGQLNLAADGAVALTDQFMQLT